MIYKILHKDEWNAVQEAGTFKGSAVDLRDGFIHFSSATQVAETAAKHFAQQADLVLLAIDENLLGKDLRWEVSRGGDLFPHLYADLNLSSISSAHPLPLDNTGNHIFPEL